MNAKTVSIAVLGVAGLAVLGWFLAASDDGKTTPTGTRQVPEGAQLVQVQLPETLSEEARMGQRAFEAICAACHGDNAAGRNGMGPPLVHKIYEPGHHADASFQLAAQNGVRAHHWNFGNMPPVDGVTRADVAAITTYVRELQRANGIE
ncbi:c-type cytochrome [Citreimonas salinaria]|uniref:Cytochrome c n=1 Tax=Citreimonas salinaria TaxID=321339 RepID=A0A1H3MY77_9RHOB|nr:cytochrome c [Citreimonas salinaria]SDY81641.1 Cytochrome c [Citreimonas salinaria]